MPDRSKTVPFIEPLDEAGWRAFLADIIREAAPRRIILFGSRATGRATRESDFDLLVLMDGEPNGAFDRYEIAAALWRRLARFRVAKDILVCSEAEFQAALGSAASPIGSAWREGCPVYEAA